MEKVLPFNKKKIEDIIRTLKEKYPDFSTPFYLYIEKGIKDTIKEFKEAFSWVPGFKNYFAVKACPNPYILEILKEESSGVDCSSLSELILAEKVGITDKEIMFTSNNTPDEEFIKARELGAIVNLDDIRYISDFERVLKTRDLPMPDVICFRYNPGLLREGNEIIGNPVEAKYGLTTDQIFEAYKTTKKKGIKHFGLHTMVVSNMLDVNYLIETAKMLFNLAVNINKETGIKLEFINVGGGVGIPYKPQDKPVRLEEFSQGVKEAYEKIIVRNKLHPIKIVMECGRAITGPHGYLITKARHVVKKYRDYVGVDANMADLMRPAIYKAYHHITVLGKENKLETKKYDVVGSLCENNDKFAIQRALPRINEGDLLVIHDAGAHGRAMGFNYNGKLRCAEVLLKQNSKPQLIRRHETINDYFATLDFCQSMQI